MASLALTDNSLFDLENALTLIKCSKFAYTDKETIQAQVESEWDINTFHFFESDTDTQGFIISNDEHIVVTFRGTQNSRDWITNLESTLVESPYGGRVHEGFWNALDSVWQKIQSHCSALLESKEKSLWIAGHSLGGALACLTATRFEKEGINVKGVYTYGQPRLGNSAFKKVFAGSLAKRIYRVVNDADIVPHMPSARRGYRHIGILKYYSDPGHVHHKIPFGRNFLGQIRAFFLEVFKYGFEGFTDHLTDNYIAIIQGGFNHDQEVDESSVTLRRV